MQKLKELILPAESTLVIPANYEKQHILYLHTYIHQLIMMSAGKLQ